MHIVANQVRPSRRSTFPGESASSIIPSTRWEAELFTVLGFRPDRCDPGSNRTVVLLSQPPPVPGREHALPGLPPCPSFRRQCFLEHAVAVNINVGFGLLKVCREFRQLGVIIDEKPTRGELEEFLLFQFFHFSLFKKSCSLKRFFQTD